MEPGGKSYMECYQAFLNKSNITQVNDAFVENLKRNHLNPSAISALAVGPGDGLLDIKLLTALLPGLKKAFFVEPDESCFRTLQDNLRSSGFDERVTSKCYLNPIQEWSGFEGKVDVVLMNNCLYYLKEQEERRGVLKKVFEEWLAPGGLVYIRMSDNGEETKPTCLLTKIQKQLGCTNQLGIEDIKQDLECIGGLSYTEHPLHINFDIHLFDQQTFGFIQVVCKPHKKEEEIEAAIKALIQDGYDGSSKEVVCVVRRNP